MTQYDEFNNFIEITGSHDLIELPSGEYVTLAEVYKTFSPEEYERHYQRWLAFDLTLEERVMLDLHNLKVT